MWKRLTIIPHGSRNMALRKYRVANLTQKQRQNATQQIYMFIVIRINMISSTNNSKMNKLK